MYEACGLLVKRGELTDHLKVDCICRPEKCRICGKSVNHNMMKVLYIWLTGKIWLLINSYSLIRKQLKGNYICQARYCVNYKIIITKTLNSIFIIWSFTTTKNLTLMSVLYNVVFILSLT